MSYQPISCNFYDELEALATLRRSCLIVYRGPENIQELQAVIKDFYIEEGAEYLKLDNGQSIRLDLLLSVDGKELKEYC